MRFCFITTVAVAAFAFPGMPAQPAKFKIGTAKLDDSVAVQGDKDHAILVVHSKMGIGKASIGRLEEAWPKTVTVQMHLKGLESLQVSSGKLTLHAAVGLNAGKPTVRVWKDGKENAPPDKQSPFWFDVRILNADGKAAAGLPLNGYFEIALPTALFEGNPTEITLSWIDFYR